MTFIHKCGAPLDGHVRYCPACGKKAIWKGPWIWKGLIATVIVLATGTAIWIGAIHIWISKISNPIPPPAELTWQPGESSTISIKSLAKVGYDTRLEFQEPTQCRTFALESLAPEKGSTKFNTYGRMRYEGLPFQLTVTRNGMLAGGSGDYINCYCDQKPWVMLPTIRVEPGDQLIITFKVLRSLPGLDGHKIKFYAIEDGLTMEGEIAGSIVEGVVVLFVLLASLILLSASRFIYQRSVVKR
jgi:hypothetical protein